MPGLIGTSFFVLSLVGRFQFHSQIMLLVILALPCGMFISTVSSLLFFLESDRRRAAIIAAAFHVGSFVLLVLLLLLWLMIQRASVHYPTGGLF